MYRAQKYADGWSVISRRAGLIASGLSVSAAMVMASRLNQEFINRAIRPSWAAA